MTRLVMTLMQLAVLKKNHVCQFLTGLWSVVADLIDPLSRELLVLSVAVVRTNL